MYRNRGEHCRRRGEKRRTRAVAPRVSRGDEAGKVGCHDGCYGSRRVLTDECELVVSLAGLPAGSTGIVVISPSETTLHRLDVADFSWGIADSIPACEATPVD